MPDKVAIHLPSMLTRKSVYERMKQERVDCVSSVSQSQFYTLWNQHYPHVSIPAVSILINYDKILIFCLFCKENRFTKCDTCCMVKDEMNKTSDVKRKTQLRQMLDDHLNLQM